MFPQEVNHVSVRSFVRRPDVAFLAVSPRARSECFPNLHPSYGSFSRSRILQQTLHVVGVHVKRNVSRVLPKLNDEVLRGLQQCLLLAFLVDGLDIEIRELGRLLHSAWGRDWSVGEVKGEDTWPARFSL